MKKTKICSRCDFTKPMRAFNNGRNYCRDCQSADASVGRARIKRFLRKLKARLSCAHCGQDDARLLDFDHWNPETKKFDLSGAVRKRVSIATLKAELRKTVPCCVSCHRIGQWECAL